MVVSFQHRFSRWGQGLIQANYTYGHAFDEVSNGGSGYFTFGSSQFPQDPNNLRGSYGPAEYDARHSFNANYVWELPIKALLRGHGSDYLVKGWQISGTIFARTGFPYTVFDNFEAGNLAANDFFGSIYAVPVRPFIPSGSCGKGAAIPSAPNPCQPPQVLANGLPNPYASFVQSSCETGFNKGTLPSASDPCGGASVAYAQGRNRFRGPGYFNTDFAIIQMLLFVLYPLKARWRPSGESLPLKPTKLPGCCHKTRALPCISTRSRTSPPCTRFEISSAFAPAHSISCKSLHPLTLISWDGSPRNDRMWTGPSWLVA